MHVIDLEGNEYALQATTTNDYVLNGSQPISLRILPTKTNKAFIDDITEMWRIVDHDGVTHKIIYMRKRGEGTKLSVEVKGKPLFFDEFGVQRIHKRIDRHMTANAFFNFVFHEPDELGNTSGYNFILNGSAEAIQWEGLAEGATRLEMFKDGLNRYKLEFRIVGNTIYLENRIGRDTQFMYRYRLNASNIVQENDATEYYTYAKGYGDYGDGEGGEDWKNAKLIREYTSPIAKIIGIREAPPIKNGNITTVETMDEELKTTVDESLKISVSATIHDLRKQGYALGQPEMGDRVFLIDERIGLNAEVRVVDMKLVRNWKGEVTDLQLTFGTPGLVKRHQASQLEAVNNINRLLEGKVKLPFGVYDARMQEAIKAMNSALTQLTVLDDGSLAAIDPNNPNYMVMLKSTGLFLSEDGGATPKQAIYGGGINASVISTGTMLADRIAGGILSSLNRNTEFDMNTGMLNMQNATFTLGGGARIRFNDTANRILYTLDDPEGIQTRTAGMAVGNNINARFPYTALGTSLGNNLLVRDEDNFTGFIANTNARMNVDGIGNSVVGNIFHVRDKAVAFSKGFLYNLNPSTSTAYFTPINTGLYNYELGRENNRWNEGYIRTIYGTLAGTSTHNAKMNIEDVDGQQAFDFINLMKIKSFYYKDEDYTNPYNRKVSPIIEQLDPTLENLYKATPDALDINSNVWLLAQAFKHYVEETNERLEVLENGA